jgi:cytochrome c oxidase subunit 3
LTVVKESGQGYHTLAVRRGLRYGMALFIVSEIMFFFAFF